MTAGLHSRNGEFIYTWDYEDLNSTCGPGMISG